MHIRHLAALAVAFLLSASPAGAQTSTSTGATVSAGSSGSTSTVGAVITPAAPAPAAPGFGTFLRPFSVTSLWNARPVKPRFGNFVIPESDYVPFIGPGQYSTGAFEARPGDPPATIYPVAGRAGVWEPDGEMWLPSITIPRWPADTTPATGGDGHADVVDSVTGVVHSFWGLKKVSGRWVAMQYAWTRIDGTGWGNPAHHYQGARAAAVPPLGGLIRKHEINDGAATYKHALSMSLTFNALSPKPAYIYPATSADTYAASLNSGQLPEGALMMLPPSFNLASVTNPALRKVANTLMTYGAYVIDQNAGTPFYIYVENGSNFSLHKNGWDSKAALDLHLIRASLRQVVAAESWLDGAGRPMALEKNMNLLSMRGGWSQHKGSVRGVYDTASQSLKFPSTLTPATMANGNGRGISIVKWSKPAAGDRLKFTAVTTGGGKLTLEAWSGATMAYSTGALANGETRTFTVPAGAWWVLYATSGAGGPSSVSGTLLKVAP